MDGRYTSFCARIKAARESLGNVPLPVIPPESTWRAMISCTAASMPPIQIFDMLQVLVERGISAHWLITGEGEMGEER